MTDPPAYATFKASESFLVVLATFATLTFEVVAALMPMYPASMLMMDPNMKDTPTYHSVITERTIATNKAAVKTAFASSAKNVFAPSRMNEAISDISSVPSSLFLTYK